MSEEKYAELVAQNYAPKICIFLVSSCHLMNVQHREDERIKEARNEKANRTIKKDVIMGLSGFFRTPIPELM